jgi:CRP-like cAMP-binding protein
MLKPDVLKKQVLFENLDEEELKKIGNIIKKLTFKNGEYIFKEHEDTKGIYLISSGKVEISKITPDGWKQTLAVLKSGHFFGELSIIEKRLHEASAVALVDTEVLLVEKEDFEKMESDDLLLASRIMKKLIFVLSKNLRMMNDKFINALISY